MIKTGNDGILVEGNIGGKSVKILWDLLDLIGSRFVIIAEYEDDFDASYDNKFKTIVRNDSKVVLLNCTSRDELIKCFEMLSDNCITDFYITVNSSFENVLSKTDSKTMFSEYEFLIDEYLKEFPRTIHITEDSFFIDFNLFKEYTYQLQRVVKRYSNE